MRGPSPTGFISHSLNVAADSLPPSLLGRRCAGLSGAAESVSVPAATGVGLFGRRAASLSSDKTEVDNRRLPVMLGRRVSADATSAPADSVTAQLGAAGARQAFLERRMRISERARACAVP
mmetsp:Transcript_152224/g.486418  ORF Transcript_152224/g.486418 Transcript_152224/m.486418 type:complete len:121 (+) Transcript_152224:579-941(+)